MDVLTYLSSFIKNKTEGNRLGEVSALLGEENSSPPPFSYIVKGDIEHTPLHIP